MAIAVNGVGQGRPALVVVCNSGENSLGLFGLGEAGDVHHLRTMPLPGVGDPDGAYPMAVSPDRQFLYVAFRGRPHEILTFAVDLPGGRLDLVGRSPLPDSMAHIATDRTGRLLFAAAFKGGRVSMHPIAADGVAGPAAAVLEVAPYMHCCLPAPSNDVMWATSLGDDSVVAFRFDGEAGSLTELPDRTHVAEGSGPRHLIAHPNGQYAYLINQSSTTVDVFEIAGQALRPIETVSALPEGWRGEAWAAEIRITPDGRFLYASDRKANAITWFAVDAHSGRLTRNGHVQTAPWPRAFNITPDGRHLIVLGEVSDTLECFAMDGGSGALRKAAELPTGKGPSWVEIFA